MGWHRGEDSVIQKMPRHLQSEFAAQSRAPSVTTLALGLLICNSSWEAGKLDRVRERSWSPLSPQVQTSRELARSLATVAWSHGAVQAPPDPAEGRGRKDRGRTPHFSQQSGHRGNQKPVTLRESRLCQGVAITKSSTRWPFCPVECWLRFPRHPPHLCPRQPTAR